MSRHGAWSIRNKARVTEFVNLKSQCFFFLYLVLQVNRSYKTRKTLLIPCMYRYTFTFILKSTTSLLQKQAIFYLCNVQQKDDGVDQNTLHPCYGDDMNNNQQT